MSSKQSVPPGSPGFTLIEVMMVLAVLAMMVGLVIPTFNSMLQGQALSRQGEILNDQMNMARQLATTRNRTIELRLVSRTNEGETRWATQIFESGQGASAARPISRLERFADGIVVNPSADLSPMLGALDGGSADFSAFGQSEYLALRFLPNGRLEKNFATKKDYLTLQGRRDDLRNPINYFTIQVNPVTGRIGIYRP